METYSKSGLLWSEFLCPLQIYMLKLNPQCVSIWRWVLMEMTRSCIRVGHSWMELVPYLKKAWERLFFLLFLFMLSFAMQKLLTLIRFYLFLFLCYSCLFIGKEREFYILLLAHLGCYKGHSHRLGRLLTTKFCFSQVQALAS